MRQSPSRAFLNSLHPSGDAASSGDVIVLTMTADQCRNQAGRDRLIEEAISALASGGIIWVDVPGRSRGVVMSTLRGKGMETGALALRRSHGASEAQIALTSRALRFGLGRGQLSARWRWAAAILHSVPMGRALLFRVLPSIGFAAFRPGTKPFAWLVDRVSPRDVDVDVALITNWRGDRAPYLLFAMGAEETIVAKRGGAHCQRQIDHEAAMLKLLGPALAECCLKVPRLIHAQAAPSHSTLIESEVPGRPMVRLIHDGHHRDLGAIAERLRAWLDCWNRKTIRHLELTPHLAERLILAPARTLVPSIERGSAYFEWLAARTAELVGSKVSLVAAHNDLTMANILGDRSAIQSVVDWEAAGPDGLPLGDFSYAVCDAATWIGGGDRVAAFRGCFLHDGEQRRVIEPCEAMLRAVADAPPEWLELCAHGTWLRHAANELARGSPRPERAFIEIAGLLAINTVGS